MKWKCSKFQINSSQHPKVVFSSHAQQFMLLLIQYFEPYIILQGANINIHSRYQLGTVKF